MRVGIVGLGAGTIAGYARKGDTYRFYEINPAVIEIAGHEFTYLKDSFGSVDVVPGDARLSLEKETAKYDVLIVDAFSGDAIPVHLLTHEAVQLYRKRLADDGVMAFHVTNRFFDLAPQVASLAAATGLQAKLIESRGHEDAEILNSSWVLVAGAAGFSSRPTIAPLARNIATRLRYWTDDFNHLLNVLRPVFGK
jgi:spermidine synthase